MAHSLFSFVFFLGLNPIEIPRIASSYTLKIKTKVRPVDFTDKSTFAVRIFCAWALKSQQQRILTVLIIF